MRPGTLYVVATPIGNLDDVTLRAVRVLREVTRIACEDTRHTRLLLHRHGIGTPVVSYHEHNEQTRAPELVRHLLSGESIALVSDAGTPLLSDPGFTLVRLAIRSGIPVIPIPGPSAITAALSVAGLPTDRFTFLGFLPRKAGERRRVLQEARAVPWTLVLFEAPHRIAQTLRDLQTVLGNRPITITRELTKKFEEVIRGTVSEVLDQIQRARLRGELTVVVAGASGASEGDGDAVGDLRALLSSGVPTKDAVRHVARTHRLSRRAVYAMALRLRGKRRDGE